MGVSLLPPTRVESKERKMWPKDKVRSLRRKIRRAKQMIRFIIRTLRVCLTWWRGFYNLTLKSTDSLGPPNRMPPKGRWRCHPPVCHRTEFGSTNDQLDQVIINSIISSHRSTRIVFGLLSRDFHVHFAFFCFSPHYFFS